MCNVSTSAFFSCNAGAGKHQRKELMSPWPNSALITTEKLGQLSQITYVMNETLQNSVWPITERTAGCLWLQGADNSDHRGSHYIRSARLQELVFYPTRLFPSQITPSYCYSWLIWSKTHGSLLWAKLLVSTKHILINLSSWMPHCPIAA